MILLTLSWSFAFLSIKMHDVIVKLLFALFNILQVCIHYMLINHLYQQLFIMTFVFYKITYRYIVIDIIYNYIIY